MNRKLLDGTTVPALDIPIELVVKTKCPGKYKLVDMETGLEYTVPSIAEKSVQCSFYETSIKI